MKIFLSIIFSALITSSALASEGPLKVAVDERWSLDYKGDGVQFYSLTRTKNESALLMFSKWPAPGNRDQIPVYLNQMAEGFLKEAKRNEEFSLDSDSYEKEKIEGIEFSGEAVVFTVQGGLYQTMFMLSNGDGIWNGQFSGSKERWKEAVEILKQLKRKG